MHLHSYTEVSNKIIRSYIFRCINKYADIVISPTESIRKSREEDLKNIVMVRTPYLDLKSNAPDEKICTHFKELKEKGTILFSFVGRIARIKRLDCFLQSLAKLSPEERMNIKYMVIGGCNTMGDKDYKVELEKFIKDNHLENNVDWVGYVTSVESVLPYVDYGVMLTLSEAMPMVGIEYLKYSIPTIGFDVPGINDFLINDVNGFLIEDKNTDMIASVLRRIIKNENIPNFKASIPETYKGYSIEKFAEALKKIY
jgi:glycosyltransferase involved in cell wall biosynthesis